MSSLSSSVVEDIKKAFFHKKAVSQILTAYNINIASTSYGIPYQLLR